MSPFGIYIHIPFCRKKCAYCSFVSEVLPGSVPPEFVHALCTEIRDFKGPDKAKSIFLGGGTPSLLTAKELDSVFASLCRRFSFIDPEITIEANPDDVTAGKLDAWKVLGINRISLGVQSFDDEELRFLGRRHDATAALNAISLVASRFDNWSMDLIYGAPVPGAWEKTLSVARQLCPPHVSTYALTYAPNTALWNSKRFRLEDDIVLKMYQDAESCFTDYDHYEISNFSRSGFRCRHNLLYWHNEAHAGFGPAAYSFIGGVRAVNTSDLLEYSRVPGSKAEQAALSKIEEEVETLIQHFRLREGIAPAYFLERFGETIERNFGESVSALLNRGLLQFQSGRLCPTQQGFYLNDEIGLALVR